MRKEKQTLLNKSVEQLKKERNELKKWRAILLGVVFLILLIFVDQFTKLAADVYFGERGNEHVTVIPGWVYLEIAYNRGIAYGKFGDASQGLKIGIIVGTAVLMAILTVIYVRTDTRRVFLRAALILIIAGGLGNLIDRVEYRIWDENTLYGVRDMINLERFGFAVCNLADFFITGGAVMLVLALLFFDRDALFPTGKRYKALAWEYDNRKNELVEVKGSRYVEDYEPKTTDEEQ
ncbi:MAG: signal peptidase II [Clostridia bacterium]|nr:signal peptidase II [Clostridia bacterium]